MVDLSKINIAVEWIKSAQRITAFTGAGISTPSGIPDFRSETSGLWSNVDPLEVASIYSFRRNPQAFYDWVRPLAEKTVAAKPNPAHLALVELEKMGKLETVITQNIDMLHTRAGNTQIYELHGHMREATCIQCFHVFDNAPIMAQFLKDGKTPHCPTCDGVIKPNVILFGEQLPVEQLQGARKAARDTDLMLVIGSSLEVAPASELPSIAKRNGAKIIIVNDDKNMLYGADLILQGDAAEILPAIVQCLAAPS